MRSSYCHEIIPSLISVLVCSFFLFSPIYVAKGFRNSWKESEDSMSGDEYKKMKLINDGLRKINKPFVKSIQSPDGDIIDCVFIHLQPAFDLPELRGTMSLGPPELPKGGDNKTITSEIKQLWSSNGESCPNGTIPIRRTSASDILKFRSISKFGKKISAKDDSSASSHEHALGCLLGKEYHGIKAIVNVWAPSIANKDDYSNSQIWVISNIPNHDVNVIEAGWMVYPGLFGDNSPRLFIYWASDGYKSGCYNLLCSGFVQTNNKITIGGAIVDVSTYNASQFNINLGIYKDSEYGNWWLFMDGEHIGYWPSTLFKDLRDHATMIQFGGEVFDSGVTGQHTSTQMGSGHFPGEGFGKAAFIKNIELIDGTTTISPKLSDIVVLAEKANCYDVTSGYNGLWNNYIFLEDPERVQNATNS